jgi:DNA polymerase-3 subunit epsilon
VIREKGRTENEIGFVLILNGIYLGFGYVDKAQESQLKHPEEYQFFVQLQKDNRDVQRIISSYIKKKKNLKELENEKDIL